jgi:RNA polymerase sigma-70 factor (ECF subfamily)
MALRQQQVEHLRHAVGSLSPSYYNVVMLCEFEQMSYKDAATVLDIPIGTVMSRLSRAQPAPRYCGGLPLRRRNEVM